MCYVEKSYVFLITQRHPVTLTFYSYTTIMISLTKIETTWSYAKAQHQAFPQVPVLTYMQLYLGTVHLDIWMASKNLKQEMKERVGR